MRAVIQDRYGRADVLRVDDVATPTPSEGEVLLRVRSASVNSLDWRIMRGQPFILRLLGFGLTRPKNRTRGVDVAGDVVAVPRSGSRFKVGDAVFGLAKGSFAEYATAEDRELVPKPEGVSFDQAATLGIAANTALQAVRDRGHVEPGQSVAVTGAGSGVGTFVVQLAKCRGAEVTAISSTENVEMLRSIGVHDVVDYRTTDFSAGSARFDVVFDVSGRDAMGGLLRTLKPGGTLVCVGGRRGFGRLLAAGLRRRLLRQRAWGHVSRPRAEDMAEVARLVSEGELKPVIDRVYPLSEAPKALARAELNRAQGKLVIHVA